MDFNNRFNLYSDACDSIIDRLLKRNVDLDVRHVVITPKPYTLFFEQRLSGKNSIGKNNLDKNSAGKNNVSNSGFFDIEILSLSRLYHKLGGKPLLPDESAVMEIKRILKNSELKCFNRSKGYAGFSHRMLETINRLSDSGITPDNLDETNPKFADVKRVYAEYIKRNPFSMAQMILSLIENSGYFKNAHVYVVNFDAPTRLEQQIFDLIKSRALSFVHAVVCENSYEKVSGCGTAGLKIPPAEIYSASNRAEEFKAAARHIKKAQRQGISLGDMCVVCAPESYDAAQRIFSEYEIDFYCDRHKKLSANALSQFVLYVLKGGLSRRDWLNLAKNPYSEINAKDSAKFENYCCKYNIEYNLAKPFELGLEQERDIPEKTRAKIHQKFGLFSANTHNNRNATPSAATQLSTAPSKTTQSNAIKPGAVQSTNQSGVTRLREFIESIGARGGDEAAKARLLEILSLINDGDVDYKDLFCEAVASAQLKPLPSSGLLSVSSAASNRGKRFKIAFILNFNEGVTPNSIAELGIIDARESLTLQLSPSLDYINQRNRDDILELIYSSENVFISYVRSPSDRPSPLLYTILEKAENLRSTSSMAEYEQAASSTDPQVLADYAAAKNGGLEHLLLTLNRPTVFSSSLYAVLKDDADKMIARAGYCPKTVKENIFDLSTISASRLQTFFDCPYKHFIRYGLKTKENEKGGMSSLDTGLLIHKAAEQFFLHNFDEDMLDSIIEKAIEDYAHKLDKRIASRLSSEIKKLCIYLKTNLKSGKFEPIGAELKLSAPRFKPVNINGATLAGSVDFADEYDGYVRIIDYKSGSNVTFENKTLYYGLKLQLPLYMYAFNQNGYKPGAMFYFPFRMKWNSGSFAFVGAFDSGLNIVFGLDSALANIVSGEKTESRVIPAAVKYAADGTIKVSGTGAKTAKEFAQMPEYAFLLSELALKQMKEGLIEPLPYKNSSKTSCYNCAYKVACGFCGSFRVLKALKKGKNSGADTESGDCGGDGDE